MAALLIDVKPGDEIMMPSYTFVSTANAFVLRGGIPVFVDIREDTLNIDERLIESAITAKTKAIVPVHYAGVSANMDAILKIAKQHQLYVIEDAAQGVMATYQGKPLGTLGSLGAYSFHATKNIISGEGGALLINDSQFISLAEIIREKGTDRSRFLRGQIDKYTWQKIGSSFLPSELNAAFLMAQLEEAETITRKRLKIWQQYHDDLEILEEKGFLKRPFVPHDCQHNGHIYYVILPNAAHRQKLLEYLQRQDISCATHYVPLHSSPGGKKFGRTAFNLSHTDRIAECVLRLPLYVEMSESAVEKVTQAIKTWALCQKRKTQQNQVLHEAMA
jgi:dTDP-4-amino-4,6-dideoxygalactose transaminase